MVDQCAAAEIQDNPSIGWFLIPLEMRFITTFYIEMTFENAKLPFPLVKSIANFNSM